MEGKTRWQVSGTVYKIEDTKTFGSGFQKREVVIDAGNEKWKNTIKVVFKKDNIDKVNGLSVGDEVELEGFVNGTEWNSQKDDTVRFFTDLTVGSIIVTRKAEKPRKASNWDELKKLGAAWGMTEEGVKALGKDYGKQFKEMGKDDWQKIADGIIEKAEGESHQQADENEPDECEDLPF